MKIGITHRLFLAILIATALAVLALFLVMGWSLNRGFYQYLNRMDQNRLEEIALALGKDYEKYGNWDFLKDDPLRYIIGPGMRPPGGGPVPEGFHGPQGDPRHAPGLSKPGGPPPPRPPSNHNRPPDFGRPAGPLLILNAEKKVVWGTPPNDENVRYRPITAQGKAVGYLGLRTPKNFLLPMQVQFLSGQKFALALAAIGMIVAVMVISFPVARSLVRPIRAMATATHDIAAGRYKARIPVTSSDELGQLARAFNDMAASLEKNEKDRRQWVADISHELRTPVSILQGEIEALLDGIRPVQPDTIRSLYSETLRLKRLINDLYQLSLSDMGALVYHKENLDILEILTDVLDAYRDKFREKGIAVTQKFPQDREVLVFADGERLDQLFVNLFENTLRYTDDRGELVVSLKTRGGQCIIEFQDSPPGVPEEDLPRLFERLYRVEGSRSRQSGGAGLGLAICKNIVEAHEGTISALPSPLGGVSIQITLPLLEGVS